jgi:CRP/FNR family transcriptional regulator, cyclic AMP receptor protein
MNPEELKSIAVLQAMDAGALTRLAPVLDERVYADGQTVFAEGDPGDSMYFILAGQIRIEKRPAATGAANKLLTVLEQGDYFGEMALMDQKPRSASAIASGNTRILRLSKMAFDELQQSGGAAGMSVLFAMIRTSSERIRRLSAQLVVYDEVGKAIGEARNLQALLDVILQQLASATAADWGLLLLCSQFSDLLELRAQVNLALTPGQKQAASNTGGFLGPALQQAQDWLVADFDTQQQFKSCQRLGFETPSMLLSPISLEGKVLGLIVLGGEQREHFDLNALNLTRGVARQAAQAIVNARHREEEEARSRHSRQFVRF